MQEATENVEDRQSDTVRAHMLTRPAEKPKKNAMSAGTGNSEVEYLKKLVSQVCPLLYRAGKRLCMGV